MKEDNMIYLILKETNYKNIDNSYDICNFTTDINKASDMLQGYRLVEKDKDVSYSMLKYEQPLKLTKEMEC
jgi:hypothetical protein